MNNSNNIDVDSSETATTEEVREAFSALTDTERIKIRKAADFRSRPLLKYCGGECSGDSLIHEAVIRLLDGRRKWKKNRVSFFSLLLGVIRSIAYEYAQRLKTRSASVEAKLAKVTAREEDEDICESIGSNDLDQETRLIWNEKYQNVLNHFSEDNEVLDMIECMCAGLKQSEVIEYMSITGKKYAAIYKRLFRGIDKINSE